MHWRHLVVTFYRVGRPKKITQSAAMAANLAERATDPHSICILFFVANYYYEKKYFIISEIRNLFRLVRNMA